MSAIVANIAHRMVGQTVQVHTLAGPFAGTLEAVIGGVVRIRGGGTVYDVDLAHVVAISYPAPAPAPAPTKIVVTPWTTQWFSPIDGHQIHNDRGRAA